MPNSNHTDSNIRPVGQITEIKFPIGVSLILSLLVCLAGLIFWFYPHLRDILTFLGSAFAMAAAVVAAYYIGKTLQITVGQRDEALTADKVNKAFSFIHRWNSAPFEERKQLGMLLEKLKLKSGADIAASLSADARSDRSLVVAVLNFFEEMCLAINEGLADEATLRKFFRDMLESYYGLFATWIQEQRSDNSHPRPRAYVQIEQVVKRWQQRN
jgi:hypothetical protein